MPAEVMVPARTAANLHESRGTAAVLYHSITDDPARLAAFLSTHRFDITESTACISYSWEQLQ